MGGGEYRVFMQEGFVCISSKCQLKTQAKRAQRHPRGGVPHVFFSVELRANVAWQMKCKGVGGGGADLSIIGNIKRAICNCS